MNSSRKYNFIFPSEKSDGAIKNFVSQSKIFETFGTTILCIQGKNLVKLQHCVEMISIDDLEFFVAPLLRLKTDAILPVDGANVLIN